MTSCSGPARKGRFPGRGRRPAEPHCCGGEVEPHRLFEIRPEVHHGEDALGVLACLPGLRRVTLVTGPGSRRRGHVQRVWEVLNRLPRVPDIDVIDDVEPDPAFNTVKHAADRMRGFDPDTLIALGGGSVMSAAKMMRLLCERPEDHFADVRARFSDGRLRAEAGDRLRIRLVCAPTTVGSGAEGTPFVALTDSVTGRQHLLADAVFTPDMALCDPVFALDLPPSILADSGFDALTHAIEAWVVVDGSGRTDGLCLTAARSVLAHLDSAVRGGPAGSAARSRVLRAGTTAGMASGIAGLGLVHAMSHSLGACFCIPHGRANALLLPHVIRYNGAVLQEETPRTARRFQHLAHHLGLPATDPHQAAEAIALPWKTSGTESAFRPRSATPESMRRPSASRFPSSPRTPTRIRAPAPTPARLPHITSRR